MIPNPASMATQAYAPSTFSYTSSRLLKMSCALTRTFPVFCNEAAKMLSSNSESESVLICRWTSSSRNLFSSGAFVRLPFFKLVKVKLEGKGGGYVSENDAVGGVDVEWLGF